MATIETDEDFNDDKIGHKYSVKKGKRRQKTRSLVVPQKASSSANERDNACFSADCDSTKFGVKRRFSFRKFRTVRTVSKLSLPNSRSNSTSSIDGGSNQTSSCEHKCIKSSFTSIDHSEDISQISSDIQSK